LITVQSISTESYTPTSYYPQHSPNSDNSHHTPILSEQSLVGLVESFYQIHQVDLGKSYNHVDIPLESIYDQAQ